MKMQFSDEQIVKAIQLIVLTTERGVREGSIKSDEASGVKVGLLALLTLLDIPFYLVGREEEHPVQHEKLN